MDWCMKDTGTWHLLRPKKGDRPQIALSLCGEPVCRRIYARPKGIGPYKPRICQRCLRLHRE